MYLKQETLDNISKTLERKLGIPYEEFDKLDFDEQQRLISEYKKSQKRKNEDKVTVMNGSGEHAIFTKVRKGEKVMIRYGNIIEAGITREEEKQRLEDDLDDIIYSKPVAFVKKLQRKIKNR